MVVAAGIALVTSLLPPHTLDELAYHLYVPKAWIIEGRVVDLPLVSHSYFPFGLESASLPFLTILGAAGGIASHLFHLILAVASAAVVWRLVRLLAPAQESVIAVAAVVSTPALLLTAGWSWVDFPLAGIAASLAVALLRDDAPDDALAAAAIAAGLLTKYTFVPFAAAIVVAHLVMRSGSRRGLAVATVAGGVAGSLFFLRNAILTANPFAPFFTAGAPAVAGYRSSEEGAAATALRYLFDGTMIDESLGITIPLGFIAALALSPRLPRRFAWTIWSVGAVALILALLAPSSRILLPFIAIPAIIGLASLCAAIAREARLVRLVIVPAIVIAAAAQLALAMHFVDRTRPLDVALGVSGERDYLAATRPLYEPAAWIDSHLPDGSRTLVVGIQELFWFDSSVRGGGNFDGPRVASLLAAESPAALRERLSDGGFTHVALYWPGITAGDDRVMPGREGERRIVLTHAAASMLVGTFPPERAIASRPGISIHTID
jgi:hypothetical protein